MTQKKKDSVKIIYPEPYGHSYDLEELTEMVQEGINRGLEGFREVKLTHPPKQKGISALFTRKRK